MSDSLFGERYFAKRDRLSHLIQGISEFAHETSTPTSALPPQHELAGFQPFRIAVFGDINCGKSSFINALIGHDLCPTSDLPSQGSLAHYLHGANDHDIAKSASLELRHRPLPLLRNFELIDTPGIGTFGPDHAADLHALLESADLSFCLFPISNPWSAPVWNFLATLTNTALDRVVFVIQQADQREPEDVRVIFDHVADLSTKRIGCVPPTFAVSARLALQAKQSSPADSELLRRSGFHTLESFIAKRIEALDHRREWLKSLLQFATTSLSAVENQIEGQARNIRDQSRFMELVEDEIDTTRETFIRRLPVHLVNVAEAFESEAMTVTKELHRKLGAIRSTLRLFVGDRIGSLMESVFIARIQIAVENVSQKDSREVVEACKDHWLELATRVHETMGIQLTTPRPIDDVLAEAQSRFSSRLQGAAQQGIHNLKVRNQLDKELRRRNTALKSFTATTLLFTTAAAVCGALSIPWMPVPLLGIAGLFFIGNILTAWITRRAITRDFKTRLLDTCGAFANTLHSDYEEALRIVFRDYKDALADVRDHLGREKLAVEPRLRRWHGLFLTLKAIEQEI